MILIVQMPRLRLRIGVARQPSLNGVHFDGRCGLASDLVFSQADSAGRTSPAQHHSENPVVAGHTLGIRQFCPYRAAKQDDRFHDRDMVDSCA
jgi:hypothetical protein